MIKVVDILTGKHETIRKSEMVFSKEKSKDYIVSIPHGGTLVPESIAHKLNLGKGALLRTDLFTDKVYNTKEGIEIIFKLSKHLVNVNRFLNPGIEKLLPFNLKRNPLHKVGKALKEEYTDTEVRRILVLHERYNNLIRNAVQEMKKEYGFALMFDCHSMHSIGMKNTIDEGKVRPDFNVGTVNDRTAHHKLIECFCEALKTEADASGLSVKKNYPYTGGAITRKYGKPSENVHAMQLEVKKSLYMNEGLNGSGNGFKIKPKELKKLNGIISRTFRAVSDEAKNMLV